MGSSKISYKLSAYSNTDISGKNKTNYHSENVGNGHSELLKFKSFPGPRITATLF
jgi:hypothetical protein